MPHARRSRTSTRRSPTSSHAHCRARRLGATHAGLPNGLDTTRETYYRQPMRQAVGIAVLLSLVVLAAASAAPRGGVPGAEFVANDGEDFGLVSNSQWLANGKPVHSVQ